MRALLLVALAVLITGAGWAGAQEVQLATYQEIAQIIYDPASSNGTIVSVTLQSTSSQEVRVPQELAGRLLEDEKVTAVVLTNEDNCVLGVSGESCILVNVQRGEDWEGIIETQDKTRVIGDSFIEEINAALDTDATYHSVFLHHRDQANIQLGTSGVVSGRNAVSAVYTLPMESSDSMYEKLSALLLAPQLRSGGFYDAALAIASEEDSRVTFSIVKSGTELLYQLKITAYRTEVLSDDQIIRPLNLLGAERLERSPSLGGGFYPLNSLVQVLVLGGEAIQWTDPPFVDSEERDGVMVPTDLRQTGWVRGDQSGNADEVIFLFGDAGSVQAGKLAVGLLERTEREDAGWEWWYYAVAALAAAGVIAALLLGPLRRPAAIKHDP